MGDSTHLSSSYPMPREFLQSVEDRAVWIRKMLQCIKAEGDLGFMARLLHRVELIEQIAHKNQSADAEAAVVAADIVEVLLDDVYNDIAALVEA